MTLSVEMPARPDWVYVLIRQRLYCDGFAYKRINCVNFRSVFSGLLQVRGKAKCKK